MVTFSDIVKGKFLHIVFQRDGVACLLIEGDIERAGGGVAAPGGSCLSL